MIVSAIAPKSASRDAIKNTVLHTAGAGGNFYTVHVATPLEHCEENDRRKVYKRARNGELKGVAGVNELYEAPERAELVVDLTTQSVPEIVHSELFSDLKLLCFNELTTYSPPQVSFCSLKRML